MSENEDYEDYEDVDIICANCKQEFVFTVGEQEFYEEHNFTPPKRCKPCRDKKKAGWDSRPRR